MASRKLPQRFFNFSIAKHFRAAKSISCRGPLSAPYIFDYSQEKKSSTPDPLDHVQVPGDVGKNLRNLGNS